MGSKLARVAAAALTLGVASASRAETAADLVKQGLAAYKAGEYEKAISILERAFELEPTFDTEFALAQAQRLAGHCDKALPHYKHLVDGTTDLATGRLIQTSIALCPQPEAAAVPDKVCPVAAPAQPTPPKVVVRRTKPSWITIGVIAGGGIALGASTGFLIASHENRADADAAASFEDHVEISNRADRQRVYGLVTLAAGVGLVGYGVYRWKLKPAATSEVAVVPSTNGAFVMARGRF